MSEKFQYSNDIIRISKFAKALSHPVRVYIIKKLSGMNTCCYSCDIVKELKIAPSTVSQHLKELKYAGLIQGITEGPFIKYCINRVNWGKAGYLFREFFGELPVEEGDICDIKLAENNKDIE